MDAPSQGASRRRAIVIGLFLVLVVMVPPTVLWLQARAEVQSDFPNWAREHASLDLERLAGARTDLERYYALGAAALANLEFGHLDLARSQAEELDRLCAGRERDWNYGNAIEDVNVVRGRLALRSGDIEGAKRHLLAAGRSPGSPQMDTFGPNMSLARDLLRKGEREVVLEYFELCRRFWSGHRGDLDKWADTVRSGNIPNFGANRF
jgi:hypothetical protein